MDENRFSEFSWVCSLGDDGGEFFAPYLDKVIFKDFESFCRFILMT